MRAWPPFLIFSQEKPQNYNNKNKMNLKRPTNMQVACTISFDVRACLPVHDPECYKSTQGTELDIC